MAPRFYDNNVALPRLAPRFPVRTDRRMLTAFDDNHLLTEILDDLSRRIRARGARQPEPGMRARSTQI